jgi:hypothetical protein
VEISQISYYGVSVLLDKDILIIDSSIDNLEIMQFLERQYNAGNNEPDVKLNFRPEVSVIIRIVGKDIEMNILADIEIQIEICVILIEEHISYNKVRLMIRS